MDILSGIILGFIQGLTEFLPVSSTGHLIIARDLLGLDASYGLSVDAVLHFATAFAVLLYFRSDLWRLLNIVGRWILGRSREEFEKQDRQLVLALILGTIPAVVFGLLFQTTIETSFRSVTLVAWALIAGSVLFLIAEYVSKKLAEKGMPKASVSKWNGLIIGFFQALALIPGLSRSGATISGGLLLGLTREEAARFAFLLSLPIIIGAGSMSAIELGVSGLLSDLGMGLIFSALTAFVTGILAIHYLLRYLKNHTLGVFIVYRLALAVLLLLFVA